MVECRSLNLEPGFDSSLLSKLWHLSSLSIIPQVGTSTSPDPKIHDASRTGGRAKVDFIIHLHFLEI